MKFRLAACCGTLVLSSFAASLPAQSPSPISPGSPADQPTQTDTTEPIVVSATRLPLAEDQSPAEVTVISAEEMAERQTDRVADALRAVPGISVSQSGAPGQLTSVFTRGLESRQTQVLIDGVPINQGLAGQFDFADLTSDGLSRIEVQRGPQSTLYGPNALAGTIQLFTRRGDDSGSARAFTFDAAEEGGSFGTFRERADVAGVIGTGPAAPAPTVSSKDSTDGKTSLATDASALAAGLGVFDYSVAASRLDTDNDRPNNQYRNTAVISDLGFTPRALKLDGGAPPRFGLLVTYSNSDTGDPGTVDDPSPLDNLVTERQLFAPNVDWQTTSWLHQRLILDYDKERQVNAPQRSLRLRQHADARTDQPLPARLPGRLCFYPLADPDHRRVLRTDVRLPAHVHARRGADRLHQRLPGKRRRFRAVFRHAGEERAPRPGRRRRISPSRRRTRRSPGCRRIPFPSSRVVLKKSAVLWGVAFSLTRSSPFSSTLVPSPRSHRAV